MTRGTGALPGGFEELVRELARIGPTNCVSVFVDCIDKSNRVRDWFPEHRMQKLKGEFCGSFIVAVKGDLDVAGLGVNVAHRIVPLIGLHFGSCWNAARC